MNKKEIGLGAASVGFGAWMYWMATQMKAKAAFWPKLVAWGIIMIGALIVLHEILTFRKNGNTPAEKKNDKPKSKPRYDRVLMILGLLIVWYFAFTMFSYTISTALLMIGISYVLGYRKWKIMILTAVITSLSLYLAFSQLFNVRFPGVFF